MGISRHLIGAIYSQKPDVKHQTCANGKYTDTFGRGACAGNGGTLKAKRRREERIKAKQDQEAAAKIWAEVWNDPDSLKDAQRFDSFIEQGAPYFVEDNPYGGSRRVYLPEAYTPAYMYFSELTGRYLRRGYRLPGGGLISIKSYKALTKASAEALGLQWDNSKQKFYKTEKAQLKQYAKNGWPILKIEMNRFDYDFLNIFLSREHGGQPIESGLVEPSYAGVTTYGRKNILDQIDFLSVFMTVEYQAYFNPQKGFLGISKKIPKKPQRFLSRLKPTPEEVKRLKAGKKIDRLEPLYFMYFRISPKKGDLSPEQKEFLGEIRYHARHRKQLPAILDYFLDKYNQLRK